MSSSSSSAADASADPARALGGIQLESGRVEVRLTRAAVKARLFKRSREATRIGRFVVLERVGMGGMGIVYAAYDPRLDRRIALKVMRDDVVRSRRPKQQAQLLREARAMAKLSHPNVVAVYDAGTVDNQVFVAMEFVPSQTLRQWLGDGHPVHEIVRVFVEAGRGLAGAHRAGLAHRDFKPENVLVPDEGAVRVTDFGLARRAVAQGPAVSGVRVFAPALASVHSMGLAGTPAYMAPEQMRGEDVDARVDQWAFCLALYEALAGHRPYEADGLAALSRGERAPAPRLPEIPEVSGTLRDTIARGLSFDPSDRFVDMDALLATLRPPRASSHWTLGIAGVAVAAGALAWVLWQGQDACPRADGRMQGVWAPASRAMARRALQAANSHLGPSAWERTAPVVDRYVEQWLDLRQQSCRAAEEGELSAELLDLRMACLDSRHAELAALTTTLLEADTTVVAHAVESAARLTPVDACADPKVLRELTPPPPPADVREASDAIRARVQRARALRRAGKAADALADLDAAVADAEALQEPVAVVEARLQRGRVRAELADRDGAAADFDAVIERGAQAGYLTAVAEASLAMVDVVGVDFSRHQAGLDLARMTSVAIAVSGEDPLRRAQLNFARGRVLYVAGRVAPGLVATEAGLAMLQGQHASPRARLERAVALRLLAKLALAGDDPERAAKLATEALEIFEALLGPEHPDVGDTLAHLAAAALRAGDPASAKARFERAAEIQRAAYGDDHPAYGRTLANLGSTVRVLGEPKRALSLYRTSVAVLEAALGASDPRVASIWINIGAIETDTGQLEDAEVSYAKGLDGLVRSVGDQHPQTALALANLARLGLRREDVQAARGPAERALKIRRKILGPDHIQTGRSERTLAEVYAMAGEFEAAQATFEVARGTLTRAGATTAELAELRADMDLARAAARH